MKGLPEDAATRRRDDASQWTQVHELLATMIERQDYWSRLVAMQWGAKPRNLPPPPEISHPGRPGYRPSAKPRTTTNPVDIARFFETN